MLQVPCSMLASLQEGKGCLWKGVYWGGVTVPEKQTKTALSTTQNTLSAS